MSENTIPIPARLKNVSLDGHVAGVEDIIDDTQNKTQKQINAEVNENLGAGGSVDQRIAATKTEVIGGASSDYDTLGKAQTKIEANTLRVQNEETRAQAAETLLQQQYNALVQSGVDPMTAADWATLSADTSNLQQQKIYRVAGTTSYTDYMWDGTNIIPMATYDNAIDDVPTSGSNNLVKSGGVYSAFMDQGVAYVKSDITDIDYNIFTNLNIKSDSKIYWKIKGNCSRYIICYNGLNTNRLVDSNNTNWEKDEWHMIVAPTDINILGLYVTEVVGEIEFLVNTKIPYENPVAAELNDRTNITDIDEKLIKQTIGTNLFNKYRAYLNTIINDIDGSIINNSSYFTSDYIAVRKGVQYVVSKVRKALLFDSLRFPLTSTYMTTETTNWTFTPAEDGYVRFSWLMSDLNSVVMCSGSVPGEFVPYNSVIEEGIHLSNTMKEDVLSLVSSNSGNLAVKIEGNQFVASVGGNSIKAVLNKETRHGAHNANPVFNFIETVYNGHTLVNDDDIAPMHIYGTTLGAGHGQPIQQYTCVSHGLTNADVGKYLVLSGTSEKYYIVRIIDSDKFNVLGENVSSDPSYPIFRTISNPQPPYNFTLDGNTVTITAISSTQMWPIVKRLSLNIYKNGTGQPLTNGNYLCDFVDVVERYEILNVPSVLQNLISNVGSTDEPVYDGSGAVVVENIYRFMPNLAILVIVNIIPKMNIRLADIMFTQAVRIGANNATKYYVPNSKPSYYNFTSPLVVNWDGSHDAFMNTDYQYRQDKPIDRVLQYVTEHGFAIGFVPTIGVGESLLDYTEETFEIRGKSGKVYPHGVKGAVVGDLAVGKIYSAAMFRCFIDNSTMDSDVLGTYYYELDGYTYLYAEFKNTAIKKIAAHGGLNGKKVSVVDSLNAELKSTIYNDGVYVSSTSVSNETSYIVLKIGD